MKKVLLVLLVGLLWCNTSFAGKWNVSVQNYYTEDSFQAFEKSFQEAKSEAISQCKMNTLKEEFKNGCLLFAILGGSGWDMLFNNEVEKNVWNIEVDYFEKTLKPEDIIEGRRLKTEIQKKEEKEEEAKRSEEQKKQIKISSIIERAKSTCKELGFKEETEKFNDCKLKLYTQEVDAEAAAKTAKAAVEAAKIAAKTNKGQTVIVGQRRSGNIYPYHCRQMGGASNC